MKLVRIQLRNYNEMFWMVHHRNLIVINIEFVGIDHHCDNVYYDRFFSSYGRS